LPPQKQIEAADFARFLLANLHDQQWEQIIPALKLSFESPLRKGRGGWFWAVFE
jgi:hypothetical protein